MLRWLLSTVCFTLCAPDCSAASATDSTCNDMLLHMSVYYLTTYAIRMLITLSHQQCPTLSNLLQASTGSGQLLTAMLSFRGNTRLPHHSVRGGNADSAARRRRKALHCQGSDTRQTAPLPRRRCREPGP